MRVDDPRLDSWDRLIWGPFPGDRRPLHRQRIAALPQLPRVYDREWACANTFRVGGDACCPGCGGPYNEHPPHPDWIDVPTIHVTCAGWLAKT